MKKFFLTLTLTTLCATSPVQAADGFEMEVADVFSITGRGIVVTGKIATGSIVNGDEICHVAGGSPRIVTVEGIEKFQKVLDSASAGDHVGLLISDTAKGDAAAGDLLLANCP